MICHDMPMYTKLLYGLQLCHVIHREAPLRECLLHPAHAQDLGSALPTDGELIANNAHLSIHLRHQALTLEFLSTVHLHSLERSYMETYKQGSLPQDRRVQVGAQA